MEVLRVALAQFNPTVGDLRSNAGKIADLIRKAREMGADVVTFPELALCGYPPEDLLLKPSFLRGCRKALENLAKAADGIAAVVGFPEEAEGKVYNAAAVLDAGKPAGCYRKVELPNYGVFDEKRYFAPGSRSLVMEIRGARIGMTVCEDVWVKEGHVEQSMLENGVSVVLNISASPFHAGKLASRYEVLAGFARRTGAFVFYNNLVGGQDELVFDGGSVAVDPRGVIIAAAKRFEEDMMVADVGPRETAGEFEAKAQVIKVTANQSRKRPEVTPRKAEKLPPVEEDYGALVLGTRDYVRKNGFEKVVLGLSGGVDSSLTAAIAVAALGAGNVMGITMPSQYTSEATRTDAEVVAANLGIKLLTVPISGIFEAYAGALRREFGEGRGIEFENLQARIRGNILMAFSNRYGWLVLTTGNKSETAVGYCTLYGDTAGGFAVIKDVPKTLVYALAELVNRKAGREIIPRSVMIRPPTAELKPNQKDEDSLPPYPTLDPILRAYVEEDKAAEEIIAAGFDPEVVKDVIRMVDRSEYKRRQAPPGVKITPKAFGKDRRLPITNRFRTGPD